MGRGELASVSLTLLDSYTQPCQFTAMNKPEVIKICGLSTPEAIDAVVEGGATHLGMIFFAKSPRHVSVEDAAQLSVHAGERIIKVAVSVNADDDYLDQIVQLVKPDMLQLHGSESVERVEEIKARYGLPVIKAAAIRETQDIEAARKYIGKVDYFLFDAKPPAGSELPGGNGVAFDWEIMDQWPENVPYMLSGGLDAKNIETAITASGTKAVDISSGVECAPGVKDLQLIREFLGKIT